MIAVVARKDEGSAVADAALGDRAVEPGVGRMLHQVLHPLAEALLRRFGKGRNQAVGRIDDQRRPLREVPVRNPELVVVAGRRIVGRRLRPLDRRQDELIAEQGVRAGVRRLGDGRHQLLELLVRQALLARPRSGALQGSAVVVLPHALKVGMTIGRAGDCPVRVLRVVVRCRNRACGEPEQQAHRANRRNHPRPFVLPHPTTLPRAGEPRTANQRLSIIAADRQRSASRPAPGLHFFVPQRQALGRQTRVENPVRHVGHRPGGALPHPDRATVGSPGRPYVTYRLRPLAFT